CGQLPRSRRFDSASDACGLEPSFSVKSNQFRAERRIPPSGNSIYSFHRCEAELPPMSLGLKGCGKLGPEPVRHGDWELIVMENKSVFGDVRRAGNDLQLTEVLRSKDHVGHRGMNP